ncbi:MAG: aspartate kinase [Planctomycetota bacterium]
MSETTLSQEPVRVCIHKFGGTSVADADRLRAVTSIIREAERDSRSCVVSSAMAGVTDLLVALSDGKKDRFEALDQLERQHLAVLAALALADDDPAHDSIAALLSETRVLADAIGSVRVAPERLRDRLTSMGERLAVTLLAAALRQAGIPASAMFADEFLETSGAFGEADPTSFTDDRRTAAALRAVLDSNRIPVVTGFVGRGPDGDARLLGRGGSDLTASLLGSALGADEVVIWTDVPGVFTADPRLVPESQPIVHLHYREASEMAYFGSKVLHPRTVIPLIAKGIPAIVRSSIDPSLPGTRIDGQVGGTRQEQIAVSTLRDIALVSIEGGGLAGVAGVSARLFASLARAQISVVMISQGSSESSICIAVREADAGAAEAALRDEFRLDIARGVVEDVSIRRTVSIVTAVGSGMKHRVGTASLMSGALSRAGVNILAIAQGSSELSISFAIHDHSIRAAARALHEAVRAIPSEDPSRSPRLAIAIAGLGRVGREVAANVCANTPDRLIGLADSSGQAFAAAGFTHAESTRVTHAKSSGEQIAEMPEGESARNPALSMVEASIRSGMPNLVLVDTSATPAMVETVLAALSAGIDVVTANKEILACSTERYRELRSVSARTGAMLLGEATIGAALPVARTLRTIRGAGDQVLRIEASLSGTIGYLLGEIAAGERLSQTVARAVELGYAEPDPSADLLGSDMQRKAIILKRLAGFEGTDNVLVEPFVDVNGLTPNTPDFDSRLDEAGAVITRRIEEAKKSGATLRYLLKLVPSDKPSVGFVETHSGSSFDGMHGSESRIVIHTELNGDRPLVISGAGAGARPTAAAVLGDLAMVAERRFGGRERS